MSDQIKTTLSTKDQPRVTLTDPLTFPSAPKPWKHSWKTDSMSQMFLVLPFACSGSVCGSSATLADSLSRQPCSRDLFLGHLQSSRLTKESTSFPQMVPWAEPQEDAQRVPGRDRRKQKQRRWQDALQSRAGLVDYLQTPETASTL